MRVSGSVPLVSTTAVLGAVPTAAVPTNSALPAMPTALTLEGYTYSQAGVARLLERLQVLPDLKNVQLQSSVKKVIGSQKVVNFTIVSDIRKGRGAS